MINNGFIDLQLNGYKGVDFNAADLTGDALRTACEHLRADGVQSILATVITDDVAAMAAKLAALVAMREQDDIIRDVIPGFHIEGPFISEVAGYVGAHPPEHVRQANIDDAKVLLDAAGGLTKIVTLAPECDPNGEVTKFLADQGATVSAGHTDASLDQLKSAIDCGLSMFTHLGNGCPMMVHRHDNIVQRVLRVCQGLTISFIADGVHVPFDALRNYIDLVGVDGCVVVTDGTAAAGLGPGRYTLGGQTFVVREDGAAWSADESHLVGATVTMRQTAANLGEHLGISDEDIARLTVGNPTRIIG